MIEELPQEVNLEEMPLSDLVDQVEDMNLSKEAGKAPSLLEELMRRYDSDKAGFEKQFLDFMKNTEEPFEVWYQRNKEEAEFLINPKNEKE